MSFDELALLPQKRPHSFGLPKLEDQISQVQNG